MKIESVDFFYLSMPEIEDIGDGSQDATLVRVRAGGYEGWGECEAAPLPSIASYVCPMSHSACKPVRMAVEGMPLRDVKDIHQIGRKVHENCLDLLQADHTLSGVDIALWDLLGKYLDEPVYRLLNYKKAFPKTPYASQLFGDTPQETYQKALNTKAAGYRAVKFGWGPFGTADLAADKGHLEAARQGLGKDILLMVDAGTVWSHDVEKAMERLEILRNADVHWLEEPFANMDLASYDKLSRVSPKVPLAAGEGCNNFLQAKAMIEYAGLDFVQIDTGRIGGITPARKVAELADERNITYVNHTFTSYLALSASIQPYAGLRDHVICEYPVEAKALAREITTEGITRDANGMITLPEKPGLGLSVSLDNIKKYLLDLEISVKGSLLYKTPEL